MTPSTDSVERFRYRSSMPTEARATETAAGRVLVADADGDSAGQLCELLRGSGLEARQVGSVLEMLRVLEAAPIHVLLDDPALPGASDWDALDAARSRWPSLPVILAVPDPTHESAVRAVNEGASDIVAKPYSGEDVLLAVRKALMRAARSVDVPPPPVGTSETLFGESAVMREALDVLSRAAQGSATVLVRGESGTGKELVARAIHAASPRHSRPFVKIDCASLPDQLLESELFGYEKGAFTGAAARKLGRVELAERGTLFLDEIGELTIPLQVKLLRLLQDREFERLGGTHTIKVDVRVVAATHRDLETMVERGQFRQDLFYRLNVVPLWLPPLRARRDDVELLARHFCRVAGAANGKPRSELADGAIKLLRRQRWPGNVRQLQNFVERLVVLADGGEISEQNVAVELRRQVKFVTQSSTTTDLRPGDSAEHPAAKPSSVQALSEEMRAAEKSALERALRHAGANRSQAARLLGISRSTLYAKLEEHGLL